LASQCGNVFSVLYPARASASIAASLHEAFAEISRAADMLLLCGDLTDYGLPEEADELVADIRAAVRIPMLAVLGNHDFESGQSELLCKVLDDAGVNVLNGEAVEIAGVGFAGISGFGGGFGQRILNAWGEPLIKQFVQESITHAVRLEQALAKLQTDRRVVMLHYSPIRATLQGEDPEIFAFLGAIRLEEPINRFRVSAVFHGHAPPRHSRWCDYDRNSRLQRLSASIAKNRGNPIA
jgi:Icc-related predicted phosphoesterase